MRLTYLYKTYLTFLVTLAKRFENCYGWIQRRHTSANIVCSLTIGDDTSVAIIDLMELSCCAGQQDKVSLGEWCLHNRITPNKASWLAKKVFDIPQNIYIYMCVCVCDMICQDNNWFQFIAPPPAEASEIVQQGALDYSEFSQGVG